MYTIGVAMKEMAQTIEETRDATAIGVCASSDAYLYWTSVAAMERNHAADSDAPPWVPSTSAFLSFKNLLTLPCASLSKENSIKS